MTSKRHTYILSTIKFMNVGEQWHAGDSEALRAKHNIICALVVVVGMLK